MIYLAYETDVLEKMILDASEKRLFRFGYKNLNLNDVAKDVGISKTTLYKTFEGKYDVASRVIERLLDESEAAMRALIEADLPFPETLRGGMDVLAGIYAKMDATFLRDLESSLPELWMKIDVARQQKEGALAALFARAQDDGVLRADVAPALLAAFVLTLIRGMYQPAFFLSHQVTADEVGTALIDVILNGTLHHA